MKFVRPPTIAHQEFYRVCASAVSNAQSRNTLLAMTARIVRAGVAYRDAAHAQQLSAVTSIPMTTTEMTLIRPLYDEKVVPQGSPGRETYDEILSSSDYCPYCSYGEISELDHFLPKRNFPDLNLLPINLVPICHRCNHLKHQKSPLNRRDHFLHPYFDELPNDVRWLFADLTIVSGGPVITYRVELDAAIYGLVAHRLSYHFRELRLENRFRREAAAILNELEAEVTQRQHELSAQQIAEHLADKAELLSARIPNSLEAAAYFAAADSPAYCAGQFRN